MGKFDGYLICSDLDGTFYGGGDTIDVNSKAVKYFTENGGKFTFVTGRTASYLPEQPFFGIMNAPAGVFNGGMIYDYRNKKILRESRLEFKLGEFVDIVNCGRFEFAGVGIYNECFSPWQRGNRFDEYADLFSMKMLKIVCAFDTVEKADEFKCFATGNEFFKNTFISKSWAMGVEFNSTAGTKGHAVDFIKKHLGSHTSIGIGDFENDINLVEYADIGVATGNAVEAVKNAVDLIVKDCKNYAIKDLIEIIESRL